MHKFQNNFKNVLITILSMCLFIGIFSKEANARFDSMLDYEIFKDGSYGKVNDCSVSSILASVMTDPAKILMALINPTQLIPDASQGAKANVCANANKNDKQYFVTNTSELDNTIMPTMISSQYTQHYTSGSSEYSAHKNTIQVVVITIAGTSSMGGIGSFVAVMAVMGVEFLRMIDLCSSFYVVPPYEYVARNLPSTCSPQSITCNGSNAGAAASVTTVATNGGPSCYWPPQIDCTNSYAYPAPGVVNPPTSSSVPYFYTCDPTWNIDNNNGNGGPIALGTANAWMIGKTRGYMGVNSEYCLTPERAQYAQQDKIGKVVLEGYPGWYQVGCAFGGFFDSSLCASQFTTQARITEVMGGGDTVRVVAGLDKADLIGFYRTTSSQEVSGGSNVSFSSGTTNDCTNNSTSSGTSTTTTTPAPLQVNSGIRLCVASVNTMIPVLIGCAPVAPPGEDTLTSPYNSLTSGTRCEYIAAGVEPNRSDLVALSNNIGISSNASSTNAVSGVMVNPLAIKKFLASEFHFTSTVIGCLQDLMVRIFIPSPSSNQPSVFQNVQANFKQLVLAVLTLYLCITAMKVLIEGRVPRQSEIAIYILKFALVYFFALGNVWYSPVEGGSGQGLYPALLDLTNQVTGWMIQISNQYDVRGYCNYMFQGSNILSDRLITGLSNVDPTHYTKGFNGIKLTYWDLIDCKMANYWNFGSCDYTLSGMIVSWMFSATLLLSMNGAFFFGVAALAYFILSFSILVKYVHIFILSMFVVTILVFTAPIFVCFALFGATKDIAESWFGLIIGYTLYPAVVFVFVSIFFMTMDKVYYGIDPSQIQSSTSLKQACTRTNPTTGKIESSNSVFCQMYASVYDFRDTCDVGNSTNLTMSWIDSTGFALTTFFRVAIPQLRNNAINNAPLVDSMLQLMLIVFLFYLISGSVTSFIGNLFNVTDLGGQAQSGFSALASLASTPSKMKAAYSKLSGSDREQGGGGGANRQAGAGQGGAGQGGGGAARRG